VLCVVFVQGATIAINSFLDDTGMSDTKGQVIPAFDEFDSALFALAFVIFNCALYTWLGLRRIKERPAPGTIAADKQNVLTAGFKRSWRTFKTVRSMYPQALVFLMGFICLFATLSTMVTLVTVYLQTQLGIPATAVGFILLLSAVATVPGAMLGNLLKTRVRIDKLMVYICLCWFVVTAVQPLLLQGAPIGEADNLGTQAPVGSDNVPLIPFSPALQCGGDNSTDSDESSTDRTYSAIEFGFSFLYAIMMGLLVGVAYPVAAALYSTIIPQKQAGEFFGLRVFMLKIAAFIPPAIFTAINEATGRLDIAYVALSPFYLVAAALFWSMNLEKGQATASEENNSEPETPIKKDSALSDTA
jgi:MFS-type transporter involved in bile tolerance (Atg22 family)